METNNESIRDLLDEISYPERNNTQYIFRKMEHRIDFLNQADNQPIVNVEVEPIDEFIWWLDISAICLKGYYQHNIGYSSVPCLKEMLVKYCRGTRSLYNYIRNNTEGKIILFEGLAYFNIFYFKGVADGINQVINGKRIYTNIFEHLEDEQCNSTMQHEIYPYVTVANSENVYSELLDESRYTKLYGKASNANSDWWKLPSVYERLKLVYRIVAEIKSEDPELNKWKSLLLAYIPEDIKSGFENNKDSANENNKEGGFTAFEVLLVMYYLTDLKGKPLVDIVSSCCGIKEETLKNPQKRLNGLVKSQKMSDGEKKSFVGSLKKVKQLFEANLSNPQLNTIIPKINKDIDIMN